MVFFRLVLILVSGLRAPLCGLAPAVVLIFVAPVAAVGSYPLVWEGETRPGAAPKSVVETSGGVLLAADSHYTSAGVRLVCYRSEDGGRHWTASGVIASDPDRNTDLGDTALLSLGNGDILASYRQNRYRRLPDNEHSYSIQVAVSRDEGVSWKAHSTVDSVSGTSAGLWASYLFETGMGDLQCYYDDEVTPDREGFHRHQWLTMRTWDAAAGEWTRPTTVSRAHNPRHLSRDGMPTVQETSPGRLLCVFESVDVEAPFRGVLRSVTSDDRGQTWSWRKQERPIVWRPADRTFNAIAPWTIRLSSGPLLCVFVTDEDRAVPDEVSTGKLSQDVKAVYSRDDGVSWSAAPQTVAAEHPCYLPGVVELTSGPHKGQVLLQYTSHGARKVRIAHPTQ